LGELAALELPVLVGASRKSFLAQLDKTSELLVECASAAAVTAAILGGAHMVRVHDVAAMHIVSQVADQVLSFADTSDSSASRAAPPRSGGLPSRK
jgi:dihydropteroate synthase